MTQDYEVLILGGGPAGLGAAMALGRLRRTALVCDDFRPRNLPAEHMHNFPGEEGLPPLEWRKKARRDVEQYDTIHFFEGAVSSASKVADGFEATLSSGRALRVKKIILAHGIVDRLPSIPGLKELWGKSVFHCPFCHGYENRGKRLGLIADGPQAMHLLPMLFGLSSDLVVFANGISRLGAEPREMLKRRGIPLVETPVDRIAHQDLRLQGVVVGGELVERDAVVAVGHLPYEMKSAVGESLGCDKTDTGLYTVGEGNRTTVPGVYAAGDIMATQQTVLGAAASGQAAGIAAVQDLAKDVFAA
jgi:thioredoxin reductase